MELAVTVVHAGTSTDVIVEIEPTATFGDLADAMEFVGQLPHQGTVTIERTAVTPRRDDRVSDVDVRSGDRLHLADSVNAVFSATPDAFGATLVAIDAHGRETEYKLRYGDNVLGRDPECDVVIKDDQCSRQHAKITLSDVVVITDLGAKNGVSVGDRAISQPTVLRPGQAIRIGDMTIEIRDHLKAREAVSVRNRIDFNRPPRIVRPYPGINVKLPQPPNKPRPSFFPMFMMLGPLLMGAFMFWMVGPRGLIILVMMPMMLVGRFIESKRTGRAQYKRELAEFHEIRDEKVEQLDNARVEEIAARYNELPNAIELGRFVSALSDRLWERAPEDEDFLRLRVGTADQPSRTKVEVPETGDRQLLKELAEIPAHYQVAENVPLAVDLRQANGVGVAGPIEASRAMARSLVVQAAALHSPVDLSIVALCGEDGLRWWDWMKWLPHTRHESSPLNGHMGEAGTQLAATSHHALTLVNALIELRTPDPDAPRGQAQPTHPAVLVVIDESCPVERRYLMPLLELGAQRGIAFMWVTSARHQLPMACGAVVEIDPGETVARAGFKDSGITYEPTRWEGINYDEAMQTAHNLTPIVDITGRVSDDSEIPSAIGFPDIYGGTRVLDEAGAILEFWGQSSADTHSLRTALGAQAGAPFSIDIRQDGPHALVAGTTGAGKSELLQSMVVGMATMHSPAKITFLLVDYKGGAAFKECVELPHTVGLVTDLDQNEVRRALVSLNAELHHREVLLQKADAKDLVEMEKKGHPETPPSLLLVVDEFAALAKEVPEFVEGVVDVALRGRSLGIHLVLATQRPQGVITPQIKANTNLRVALRVAADDDSNDVIGSPVAASLDRRLPGRAVARIGPKELVSFQSAYVGGHTLDTVQGPSVRVRLFGFDHDTEIDVEDKVVIPPDQLTDLERLVVNHRNAFNSSGLGAPRRPWLPPLAHSYEISRLPMSPSDEELVIGVIDIPERQLQGTAKFQPDRDGSLLVFGTSGSGKTVLLRSIATSAGLLGLQSDLNVQVYGMDFAGRGLEMLEELPYVGAVVTEEEQERTIRLLRRLRQTIDQRSVDFAAVRAQSLPEYRARKPEEAANTPRIIVLLDGFAGFQNVYERVEKGQWLDLLPRLISEGRQVGVHFVMTADRRMAVPMKTLTVVQRRIIMRMASVDDYVNIGAPKDILSDKSPPGRCILDNTEVQIGVLSGSADGARQAEQIHDLANGLRQAGVPEAPSVAVLPTEIPRESIDAPSTGEQVVIGLDDTTLGPATVPLGGGSVLIAGPPRSGRTTALATMAQGAAHGGAAVFFIHSRESQLARAPFFAKVARGDEAAEELVNQLNQVAAKFGRRVVIAIDDLTEFTNGPVDKALDELIRTHRDNPVTVIGAVENQAARRVYTGTISELKKQQLGVLLQPDADADGSLLSTTLPRRTGGAWPEGRGYLVQRGSCTMMQFAMPQPW